MGLAFISYATGIRATLLVSKPTDLERLAGKIEHIHFLLYVLYFFMRKTKQRGVIFKIRDVVSETYKTIQVLW